MMTERQERLMRERALRDKTRTEKRKVQYKLGQQALACEASRRRCAARYKADPEKEIARVRACQRAATATRELASGQITLFPPESSATGQAKA